MRVWTGCLAMSDDVPNPLYAFAFLAGAWVYSLNPAVALAILVVWTVYGLYKQQTAGIP